MEVVDETEVNQPTISGGALHGVGWATTHPKKLKKVTIVGLLCEVLNNFNAVLVFDISKSPLIGVVIHLEN